MSIIRNYGIHWEREHIQWGTRGKGNQGNLYGFQRYDGTNTINVDFRNQAGVYVLYEGSDIPSQRVVYVGQAGGRSDQRLFDRLKQHSKNDLWNRWQRFSWFGLFDVGVNNQLIRTDSSKKVSVGVPDALNHVEGILITILEPLKNKQGASWRKEATQYFQWTEEPKTQAQELQEIADRIETRLAGWESQKVG